MNLHDVKPSEDELLMAFLRERFNNPKWSWWWHENHPDYTTAPDSMTHHMGQTEMEMWQTSAKAWNADGRTNAYDY